MSTLASNIIIADVPTCVGIVAEAFKIYVYIQCSDPYEAGRIGVLESASFDLKSSSVLPDKATIRSPSWHEMF
jgi:hypothetical protein